MVKFILVETHHKLNKVYEIKSDSHRNSDIIDFNLIVSSKTLQRSRSIFKQHRITDGISGNTNQETVEIEFEYFLADDFHAYTVE